ncbi:hypothetical protein COOONC_13467, partial [Cooperia oncophora]
MVTCLCVSLIKRYVDSIANSIVNVLNLDLVEFPEGHVVTSVYEFRVREMDQVFDGLRATVAGVHREMKEELDKSKKEIEKVDSTLKSLLTV